ncbi:hypothetical protein PRZ48_014052 [Zasmidium cellare]|uniref:DDHD domain-containing protein n=1 Tax=Zasmidium cellare TaxID=395010 RepID=A0ABR0E0H3_ZASCE|nr:hypothetical protein PRZ48_014052 [Zasmidium cellare]
MTSSPANQYVRQVLHQPPDPPPPIHARFFYTSPIPIDDPLSPLPPPSGGESTWVKQPPKPFSEYDNAALDKAWGELRRKILKFNEERGEKEGSREGRGRRSEELGRGERRGSGSKGSVAKVKAKHAASGLREVDVPPEAEGVVMDAPENAAELGTSQDTSGRPFTRLPSQKKVDSGSFSRSSRPPIKTHDTYEWEDPSHLAERSPAPEKRKQVEKSPTDKVAVGVSRLHQVEMPDLLMTPIYWAPVHDTAQVARGTWFYKDTMLPVETPVANMLEAGYLDLQCWTQTWQDELNSAVEVGAIGEMKIVHKLWPDKVPRSISTPPGSRRGQRPRDDNLLRAATTTSMLEGEPETVEQQRVKMVEAACDVIDISTGAGGPDNKAYGESTYGRAGTVRTYGTCGVIYANEREAKILKPTLLPSAYYGRRPLANYIRKGHEIGIPVVRGFNQSIWDKLHPPKHDPKRAKAAQGVASAGPDTAQRRKADPDLAQGDRPQVTDLIFVIHGIGQKLSQRMESFHFTHAINAFRREIMVERGNKEVKAGLRRGMGGIMVLPINWRHSLSFEEGGYRPDDPSSVNDPAVNEFTLDDITPDTLPSVRGIVSDVMLDIPYYMSHHQPKMIAAVIKEANRVYKLWCQNNPGFSKHGKVHIIAHSLGSVMSIDILSNQPTVVPPHLSDPTQIDIADPEITHFLFNTHNLFLAGSPAGFFILLRKSQLRPRIDHPSAQALADPESNISAICGERGQYGCISVDNVYNIVNGYDPVAYRMNACVDAFYAASLRKAFIPSSVPSFWIAADASRSTRWFGGTSHSTANNPSHPTLPRLPSNVELETHNFTREEVAEKRMLLLNDNGQIDYFVKYGGGTFEIQEGTFKGLRGVKRRGQGGSGK